MTEHGRTGRRSACWRMSGWRQEALARWMRACANNPWRVVLAWVVIIASLIFLVATIGGSLRDEFTIPGSDTQKATDLIKAEFSSEQGAVLNIVFAAPAGERLDTPARKAAILKAIALLKTSEFKPHGDKAGLTSVANPFDKDTFSKDGRIAYAEAQFDQTIEDADRDQVVAVEDAVRQTVEPAGVTVEYNGEAEFPPLEQGISEALGLLAAIIVLLFVFRTFVAMLIPIALAIVALMTAFLLLFILAGQTDINTVTPILVSMIGLGVGIDYSLFIVTRFRQLLHDGLEPRVAAAEAGSSAGRAVLFAGLTVAISVSGLAFIGLDFVTKLGIGSALGVLTTVLIANSLLIAVLGLLGHKIDRLKVPFTKPFDDSEEARDKTLIARWGRFVTRNAKVVFPVVLIIGFVLAGTSALVRLGAADQGTQPKAQTSRRAYDLLAEGFGAGFNGPIPIVVDVKGDQQAPQRIFDDVQGAKDVASVRAPQFNDEKTVAIVFVTPSSAPQDAATDSLVSRLRNDIVPAATARRPGRRVRLRSDGRLQGHRRPDHQQDARVPAVHHRGDVPAADDGVPVGRGRDHRGSDHDPLGVHRLRRARPGRATGLPARHDGPRHDRSDRDIRTTDRVRDPVRALDGLHGVHHEPHPRGARQRAEHEGRGRARDLRDRPGRRRRRADHGHRLRGVHPQRRPHSQGVRDPARRRDPDRRAHRPDDARVRPS